MAEEMWINFGITYKTMDRIITVVESCMLGNKKKKKKTEARVVREGTSK